MILVDSNVLIDILEKSPTWGAWSRQALADASDRDDVAINPIIYAEVSVTFERVDQLDSLLDPAGLRRLDLPYAAAFVAGKAFLEYRRRGGSRPSLLPDFYIGAHASIEGMALLTRDAQRYASYFPKLALITP